MRKRRSRKPKDGEPCYYCGKIATTIDHVIPQSMIRHLAELGQDITMEMISRRILTIPACRECNCLLGNSCHENLNDKKRYLKDRLKKRYKKLLNLPNWNDSELEEYGYFLRSYIEASIKAKELIQERLRW